MLLAGYKDEEGWVLSRWNLTYKTGWDKICTAVFSAYGSFDQPEVLTDQMPADIKAPEDILKLEEKGTLTIRGMSKIIKVPVSITFYNQMNAVDVSTAKATSEFINTDYQKLNMSLCQFLDSLELAMYR